MPQRKRKVLVASLTPLPLMAIVDSDWKRLETDYRHALPVELRMQILGATTTMVATSAMENGAAPVKDALATLVKIRKAAKTLGGLIAPVADAANGAWYARHLLMNHIRDRRLGRVGDIFPIIDPVLSLAEVLTSCASACDVAVKELHHPDHSIVQGEAWNLWIRQLTAMLDSAKLPTSIGKTRGGHSAFIFLAWGLQQLVPHPFRQHTHSPGAFAKAIARTR